jgi:hypothetical protein
VKERHIFDEVCVANENDIGTPYLIAFSSSKFSGMREVYIAFRGTWNAQNWVQNMSILPHFTGNKGRIHSGFKGVADRVCLILFGNFDSFENYSFIIFYVYLGSS